MEYENLYEIMAYILREVDREGNPDNAINEFNLSYEDYKSIVNTIVTERYINTYDHFMDEMPDIDSGVITTKGYQLIKKFY